MKRLFSIVLSLMLGASLFADNELLVGNVDMSVSVDQIGGASITIPIEVPAGVNGMQPDLALVYNSHSGYGIAGWGWNLAGISSIQRTGQTYFYDEKHKEVSYNKTDRLLFDGERLLLKSGNNLSSGSVYRTERESFRHIEMIGPRSFNVEDKDGTSSYYYSTGEVYPDIPYKWVLQRVEDANGNYMTYSYYKDNPFIPRFYKIEYTQKDNIEEDEQYIYPDYRIEFYYQTVSYKHYYHLNEQVYVQDKILSRIDIVSNEEDLYSYKLEYDLSDIVPKLISIKKVANNGDYYAPTTILWSSADTQGQVNIPLSALRKESYLFGDFNGDGRNDIFSFDPDSQNAIIHYNTTIENTLSYSTVTYTLPYNFVKLKTGDYNGDGRTDLIGVYSNDSEYRLTYLLSNGQTFTSNSHYSLCPNLVYAVGDFDGDGDDDFINQDNNMLYAYGEDAVIYPEVYLWYDYYGNVRFEKTSDNIPLDFNGNGKTDIFCLIPGTDRLSVMEYNTETHQFENLIHEHVPLSNIKEGYLNFGDFNADGKTDLIYASDHNPPGFYASTFLSDGKTFIYDRTLWVCDYRLKIHDYNGDGLSDIGYFYTDTEGKWHLRTEMNNGEAFVRCERGIVDVDSEELNADVHMCFLDMHASGFPDLLHMGNKDNIGVMRVYDNNPLLVNEVVDGMGNTYNFTYKSISNSNVYTNTRTGANHVLPLVQPFYVVSDYTAPYTSLSYHYKNGRYHTQGKGLFGFEEVTTTDNLNQTKKKDVCSITTAHLHYYPYSTTTTTLSGDTISYLKYRYTVRDMGGKCIFAHHAGYEYTDYLTGLKEVCVSNYDNNGNLDNETKTRGDWQEVSRFQYVNVGSWCPNKLNNSLTYNVYNGSTSPYRRTFYKYDSRGNMIRQTIDTLYTDTYRLVNQYEYDDFGNIIKETISGSGQTRKKSYTYSYDGRFMLTATDEYGHLTTYAYDTVTTLVSSVTTPAGTTSYTYDAFGRNIQTVYPDGVITTSTLQYASPISNVKYKTIETTTNKPTITTYHASDGKPLYVERTAFNNKLAYTAYAYHLNGAEKMVSSPYFSTNVTAAATQAFSSENATYYNYDRYRRPSRMESPEGITLYSYDGLNTTIITPTISKTTKLNSSGFAEYEQIGVALTPLAARAPSYQDVYKKVSYTYYPTGQVKTATPDGGAVVTMQYDVQGNRTKLIDPDAGTITNTYNAFGQVLTRSQNVHGGTPVVTTLEYEASNGRLSKETIVGDTTTTTTYSYNSTFRDKPYRVVGKNKYATYAYDEYGNATGYLRAYDSKYGRVATYYDKGLIVRNYLSYNGNGNLYYTYDNYGNMISEKYNSTVAWELLEQNARGQVVRERKGGVVTTYTYDNCGRVTSIVAPNIVSLHYTYDADGNVLSKTDAINNQSIEYTYDHFMRLVSWTVNDNSTHSITYDATTGNIISKSDLGNNSEFTYNSSSKPHALRGVNDVLGDWGSTNVSIDYTDFGKVSSVQQGADSYEIIYGVEKERIYTQETLSGKTTTRYYMPNYEFVVDTFGNESCIIYLCNGSIAVYDETANTKTLYHGYYDAQGSLIALTDNSGNVLARYAYDPWGKRVAAINWNYSPTYTPTLNIDRGYTMHEHLDEFGLINMNGRVYDPTVAQFLSPDPYIQDASNWLNYNRYAYCYNNPTRYVDPNGELIWVWATACVDFVSTLFNGGLNFNKEIRQNAWRKFDPTAPWSKTYRAEQLFKGMFKTDSNLGFWGRARQLTSRLTREFLQTTTGYLWSHARNIAGVVDRVDYYGGATFVTNENASNGGGVSLGSYININITGGAIDRPFEQYITYNPTYMHEYGHYIQSQMLGPLYTIPAISSGVHTLRNKGRTMTYNYWPGIPVSRDHWTETWANRLAAGYFGKYEGVDWERDRFRNGHRSLPLHIYYPLESFF